MKFNTLIIATCSVLVSSCATTLNQGAETVISKKSDPKASCSELGTVSGNAGMAFGGRQGARNSMKNKTFKLGGNYLRIDVENNGFHHGTAFKCP